MLLFKIVCFVFVCLICLFLCFYFILVDIFIKFFVWFMFFFVYVCLFLSDDESLLVGSYFDHILVALFFHGL